MNLYNKYRPTDWDEIIGNEAEIESLKKALDKKDRPHVFLFVGPSGCGKTTLAKIAAKKLGADELSISEINSANNRGIDTAREIISQMAYIPPTGSGVRIFIIDEVHKTTGDWQNAMLKPLEDTPEHVFFFLCTTNPTKLIAPLKTRCTIIKVTSLDDEAIYRLLRRTAKNEGIEKDKEILRDIADNCSGSPRTALVLLEKIVGIEDEKMIREIISIGEEAEKEIIDLCRKLLDEKADWKSICDILKGLKDQEPEKIRYAVLGYMNSCLLSRKWHRAAVAIECFSDPFYNTGRAGLTLACFQVIAG